MSFKVVCISNTPINHSPYADCLKLLKIDDIYTVIFSDEEWDGYLLDEVKSTHFSQQFNKKHFRKIDESFAEKILEKIKESLFTKEIEI